MFPSHCTERNLDIERIAVGQSLTVARAAAVPKTGNSAAVPGNRVDSSNLKVA